MLRLASPNRDTIRARLPLRAPSALTIPAAARLLFLCFTNRSGSNYLGNLLAAAGLSHNAEEYFNADLVIETCTSHRLPSFQHYFSHVVRTRSRRGTFLTKVAAEQLALLAQSGILDQLLPVSRFIVIERSDKLAQAISLSIAEQTQQWAWYLPAVISQGELRYSQQRIAELIEVITEQEVATWRFFGLNGIVPLVINYDSLIQDPQTAVDRITAYMRLPRAVIDPSRIELRRQATALNELWRQRFLQGDDDRLVDVPAVQPVQAGISSRV
jgi:trehalose 2-sulfotransferase